MIARQRFFPAAQALVEDEQALEFITHPLE